MPYLITRTDRTHMIITGSGNGAYGATGCTYLHRNQGRRAHHYRKPALSGSNGWSAGRGQRTLPRPACGRDGPLQFRPGPTAEFDKGVTGNETGINSVEDMKRMAEEYGFDLKTTHPDEVAEMALAGIPTATFGYWLTPMRVKPRCSAGQR